MSILWRPSKERLETSEMTLFQSFVESKKGIKFNSYSEFHRFSVDSMDEFWSLLIEFYSFELSGERRPVNVDSQFDEYGWFPNLKLNFAENLLKKGAPAGTALSFVHESGAKREISYQELRSLTSRLQSSLKSYIGKGDVLACYMPNLCETVISMLAATSLGGVFTSTSADFGVEGVVDRFSESRPKVLVCVSGYEYNGKTISLMDNIKEISRRLPSVEKIIIVDFLELRPDLKDFEKGVFWDEFLQKEESELSFEKVSFQDPLYIMYSSGTTGRPKCIVHSTGGTLVQHVKELGLHTNLNQSKTIFYFTTCGWMMWNWLMSSLFFGAKIVLYEGSPGRPSLKDFFSLIEKEKINIFGTSPKFLKALEDSGYDQDFELESLETILSTGAPLLPEQFDFIYEKIKSDVCTSSISGGTDIIGCFMLGNPNLPVNRGEIQCLGLSMDVACFNDQGEEVSGEEGELVCKRSFPSRPLYFLNDERGEKIKGAYFSRFEKVWHHGDFIKITDSFGVQVLGRSDATLNPGGVRIGTAEIYRQTERVSWVEDSLCVGRPMDGDVEVVLFVKLKNGEELSDERVAEIKRFIKKGTTPRHTPRHVWSVSDIPYTRSGKKMELPITRILNNRALTNIEAVSNPECLKEYERFAQS